MSVLARYLQGEAARKIGEGAATNPMAVVAGGSPAMDFDWTPYLTGGGARPDAVSGLDAGFQNSLATMFSEAPPEIKAQLRLSSGYRSEARQAELWNAALAKYGDPEVADNWVARPGKSNHNHGSAVDLKYLSPKAETWVHQNAARYGLHFPMSWEPWHIEPAGPMARYAGN